MCPRSCPAAPGACERYKPKGSSYTYYVNTSAIDFDSAELLCNDNGGHLASFTSMPEVGAAAVEGSWGAAGGACSDAPVERCSSLAAPQPGGAS